MLPQSSLNGEFVRNSDTSAQLDWHFHYSTMESAVARTATVFSVTEESAGFIGEVVTPVPVGRLNVANGSYLPPSVCLN